MSPDNEDEVAETTELIDPIGHARVVYLGPVDAERENLALEWDLGIPEDAAE